MSAQPQSPPQSTPPSLPPSLPPSSVGSVLAELDRTVRGFAAAQVGRELQEDEQQALSVYMAVLNAQAQASAPASATPGANPAADALDSGRQRILDVIRESLGRAQQAVTGSARAGQAAERAVLGAVERAQSLQDLMPSRPAPGGGNARATPMELIAAHLAELIKLEVDACFQRQIGPLAGQLQAVIDAAQANGLLPEKSGSASADESRGTGHDSDSAAARHDRDNNSDNAAQANGPAASQGNQ